MKRVVLLQVVFFAFSCRFYADIRLCNMYVKKYVILERVDEHREWQCTVMHGNAR